MRRYGIAAGAAITLALLVGWIVSAPQAPPSFDEVRAQWRPSDTLLLDRNGDPLYERRIDVDGRRLAWTALDEISPALERAVIASEDRRFHDHYGVDLYAIAGAITARRNQRSSAREQHDHDAARGADRSFDRARGSSANDRAEVSADASGDRARAALDEGADSSKPT
jgi:membrane peptidoglycan carboxypeptidase